jgi:hypothetical protein
MEVKGYHIPHADVRLLSPQIVLSTIGGTSLQTTNGVKINLDNGIALFAPYCPHSNLPLLLLAKNTSHPNRCSWSCAFGFTLCDSAKINEIKTSLLNASNSNLSQLQKEVILWRQCLSHASLPWVQSLMRNRKFLPCLNNKSHVLHQGSFIRTNSHALECDITGLKCVACLCAKAIVRSPSNLPPRQSPRNMTLKENDLKPGSCISADHYFSLIQG